MYLETERLTVRDFAPSDAADLYEILGNEETMQNCEPAYSFEKTEDFLNEFCIGKKGAFAAVYKNEQKVIGYILFKEYEKDIYEIGWIFNKNYWQRGFAYEACNAVINHAFSNLGAQKVFSETVDTEKSIGLMKKLGMKQESVEHPQNAPEGLADLYLFSILPDKI